MEYKAASTSSLQHMLAERARLDLLTWPQDWCARQRHTEQEQGSLALFVSKAEIDAILQPTIDAPTWSADPIPSTVLEPLQAQIAHLLVEIAWRTAASVQADMCPSLVALAQPFNLAAFNVDVILICLAPDLNWRYQRWYTYLHDNVTRRYVTGGSRTTFLLTNAWMIPLIIAPLHDNLPRSLPRSVPTSRCRRTLGREDSGRSPRCLVADVAAFLRAVCAPTMSLSRWSTPLHAWHAPRCRTVPHVRRQWIVPTPIAYRSLCHGQAHPA